MTILEERVVRAISKNHKSLEHGIENFSIGDWNNITSELIRLNNCSEIESFHTEENQSHRNSYIWYNQNFKEVHLKNSVWEVTFDNFYPQITYNIIGDFKFNYIDYPFLWENVYDNYKAVKDSRLKDLLKLWINWSFGAVNNDSTNIKCNLNYQFVIKKRANSILREIKQEFQDHIIYIETDQIFFRGWEDHPKISNYINTFGYDWHVEEWVEFLFIDRKRYVGLKSNNDDLVQRGFKTLSS